MRERERSVLEAVARPLLELIQLVTGLETSFVTQIDWIDQGQVVLFANNRGDLQVEEGSTVPWSDSMCRWAFLTGHEKTSDVPIDFPGSLGGEQLGMRSFFAVPILADDRTIGTVCGASQRVIELSDDVMHMMRLVAEAIATQLRLEQLAQAQRLRAERAEQQALTDPLTGLPNRRAFSARWEEELARSGRQHHGIALLLVDVDEFKKVNDENGHDVGDRVLIAVADAMRAVARTEDVLARLGGDEFAMVLSYVDADGAAIVAARLRTAFAALADDLGVACTLTVGIGTSDVAPRRELFVAADRSLYRGKSSGRDRIDVWQGSDQALAGPTA